VLIKEALSILQKANTKIAELGVELVDLDANNSPGAPAIREQLNQSVIRYDLLLKFIELNDAGTAILGTTGDNDGDLNGLLIQLQEVADLNEFVLPSPIIRIVETDGDGEGLPDGASEGDLVYFHNGEWVLLPKGASGESLVATPTTIQWQSQVGNGIPSGGSTGQVLRKASNTDYIVEWGTPVLADITDVTAGVADVNILLGADAAGITPTNISHLSGTSSNIQTQLNSKLSTTLNNNQFWVGNGSNVAAAVTPSGDVTFNSSGAFSIAAGAIVNADISGSASITRSKLANGNTWRLVVNNGSGVMSEASAITASRVLVSDSNGVPTHTTVTATTIAFMDATSSVQTQMNNRLSFSSAITPAQGDIIYFDGSDWVNLTVGTNGQLLSSNGTIPVWVTDPPTGLPVGGTTNQYLRKSSNVDYEAEWHTLLLEDVTDVSTPVAELNLLNGLTVNSTLLNYLTGASGNLQTQIDNKLSNSLAQNYLFIGNASSQVTSLAPGSNGQVLTTVGTSVVWTSPATPGDVSGPGSGNSTDNAVVRWSGTTGASIQNSGIIIDDSDNTTYPTGATLRTSTTDTNTLLLQAYNVYTTAYVTFGTLTAGNPPTFDLNNTTTVGGDVIYRNVSGKSLAQPTVTEDGKSIRYNDGAGEWEYYTPGGGGGHTIQGNGTPLAARTNLNFLADFVVADDSGNDATTVTIAAFTGDVTKTQGGTALTIANDAVTFAKFQNITDARLLGRSAGSDGDMMHITVSSPLTLSAGALGIQVANGSQDGYLSSADWTTFNAKWAKPSFTTGSVLFWGASDVDQDNTKFFYDAANDLLYVGANSGAFTNSIGHFQRSANSYAQVNVFNPNSGASASGDYIVTADNGTDNTNYIDLGIGSSAYSDASYTIVGANDGYLYTNGGNLAIGTQSSKYIVFHTGGTLASNERMRIASDGKVGIGTASASAKLHVKGDGTTTGELLRLDDSASTNRTLILDNGTQTHVSDAGSTPFRFRTSTTTNYIGFNPGSTSSVVFGNPSGTITLGIHSTSSDYLYTNATSGIRMTRVTFSNASGNDTLAPLIRRSGGTSGSSNIIIDAGTTSTEGQLRIGFTLSDTALTANTDRAFGTGLTWAYSSGTPNLELVSIKPNLNLTGTYVGSVRGFVYDPTLTSTTGLTNIAFISSSGLSGFGTLSPTADVEITQAAKTSAWVPLLKSTPGDHTGLTAATEFISRDFLGATQTWADGTVVTQRFNYFRGYTLNKTTTSATFTDAYNVYLDDLTAGAGVTITNKWSLGVAGNVKISGTRVNIANLPTSSAGLATGDLYTTAGTLMVA
jgi:hypothetical protein